MRELVPLVKEAKPPWSCELVTMEAGARGGVPFSFKKTLRVWVSRVAERARCVVLFRRSVPAPPTPSGSPVRSPIGMRGVTFCPSRSSPFRHALTRRLPPLVVVVVVVYFNT